MAEVALTPGDLRAAVAAGHLTEAQAAGLTALAQARAGRRAAMPRIDEPFELFRGFNEIFVSIGVILLMSGLGYFAPAERWYLFAGNARGLPDAGSIYGWTIFTGILIWGLAEYFTRRRRMVAPSIILVLYLAYTLGVSGAVVLAISAGLDRIEGSFAADFIDATNSRIGLRHTIGHIDGDCISVLFPTSICHFERDDMEP